MKKFILALLCFLALSGPLYGANTGWNPKPDGVHAKSPIIPVFLNQTAIDALTPTIGSLVHNTTTGLNQWYDGVFWVDPVLVGDSFAFDVISGNRIVVGAGTAPTPAICFVDCDNGLYMGTTNDLYFLLGNSNFAFFEHSAQQFRLAAANTGAMLKESATATNPTIVPNFNYKGDGMGSAGQGQPNFTSNDIETFRAYSTHIETFPSGTGHVRTYDDGSIVIDGGVSLSGYTTIFGNYSSGFTKSTIFANASTAALAIYLPDLTSGPKGYKQIVSKTDEGSKAVTLDGYSSQTIDGNLTRLIEFSGDTVTIVEKDGNWKVIQSADSFQTSLSSLWVNGPLVQTVIANQSEFVAITHFVNVGEEDANLNAVGSASSDNITVGVGGGGDYMLHAQASTKTDSGTNIEILIIPKITLATPKTITDATNATPIVVTTSIAHALKTGDYVTQSGVVGNTAANGDFYITFLTPTTYSLQTINTTYSDVAGNGAYVSDGTIDAEFPGNVALPVSRSQTLFGRGASSGTHDLFPGDVLALCALNRSNANEIDFTQIQFGIERIEID